MLLTLAYGLRFALRGRSIQWRGGRISFLTVAYGMILIVVILDTYSVITRRILTTLAAPRHEQTRDTSPSDAGLESDSSAGACMRCAGIVGHLLLTGEAPHLQNAPLAPEGGPIRATTRRFHREQGNDPGKETRKRDADRDDTCPPLKATDLWDKCLRFLRITP